jgi:hypothetical protein
MGKYHSAVHMALIVWFVGDIVSMCTSTMESFHRWACTNLYLKTSGRYASNLKEMAERCQESIVQIHDEIARIIRESQDLDDVRNKLHSADIHSKPNILSKFGILQNTRNSFWINGNFRLNEYMHAIAVINFERLCIKGLVTKMNRKLTMAVSLLLAYKFNENSNTYHKTIKHSPQDIFIRRFYNEQKIIKLPNTYKVGDQVRLKIKKKIFDKGDITTHSKNIYLIDEIKRNKYKLNNNEWYKQYEITPANTVEFFPDDQYPEVEKEINEIIKPVPRKRVDVNEELIINDSKRGRKTIDYNKLNKGL